MPKGRNHSREPSWPSRLYRWAYWFPRDLRLFLRYGRPQKVVYFGGTGFGDDLLLATVLHELRKRGERRLAVVSRLEELFQEAPFVDAVIKEDWRILEAAKRFGGRPIKPTYYVQSVDPHYDIPSRNHIITAMCHSAGIRGRVDLRTYLTLTSEERVKGQLRPDQAVIQATAGTSTNFSANKVWHRDRYQAIVDHFRGRLNFVQLGSTGDPLLKGVMDQRGRTTVRESAAILSQSRLCVTYVGFLMHLARAVDIRSVVIFGGRERPDQSGYTCNENLFSPVSCAPCWLRSSCHFARECMDGITAPAAIAAAERILATGGAPLETAQEDVPDTLAASIPPWVGRHEL